ncbi:MAG: Lrp/AsnC ligand binding domain-containing protein [Candidatus Helarchaeota archaeon]|nr:Lrp/AsnC ligand binding domain-containing protein [Candidatus Helarchaeota archaeon]
MADTIAFILIEIASGEEYKFVNDVRDLKEVSEAYIVYGAWDIIVRVQTEGMGELNSVVLKIRKMAGVKRSATLIALTGDEV